ncbi:MAG: hypothetical protein JRI23_01790 [Deltaproteobacteria bacterium]|jgi:hypothetical protein|nr:hypothetical protein [Deltaproteobacteria bacterium]MBW2530206.1 hypothetical protein [Deltaproteobacteria bacterium]
MKKHKLRVEVVIGLGVAALVLTACSRASEFCDAMCECEHCNDRKKDECVIGTETAIDQADAYDCGDDYDEYLQCVLDEADCDENDWRVEGDDCDNEQESYWECVADASDRDPGGSTGTYCFCNCTCEMGATASACEGSGCCSTACSSQCEAEALGMMINYDETCDG